MATTGIPGIQCAHCGWQNNPGARMCGGCGRPLTASATNAPATNAPMKGGVPPDEAITDPELQTVAAPRGRATPVAPPIPSRIPSGRRMSPVARVFLILGVVVLLLACVCAGAWGLVIRPALHNQVDSAIRAQLNTMVGQASQALTDAIPLIQAKGGSLSDSVSAVKLNQQIAENAPAQSPVTNTHVSFADGQLKITFDSNNQQNSISTILATSSGHLVARGTTVTGLIAILESGPELELAINDALSKLPPNAQSPNPQFTSVTLADDVLSYTIAVK